MICSDTTYYKITELHLLGQNPRKISKADFNRLVESIKINGFWKHRPLAIEKQDNILVVLAGNQRLKAAKRLRLKEIPCVLYSELSAEERADIILRDNINNGEWDSEILQIDDMFQDVDFSFIGLDLPEKKELETENNAEENDEVENKTNKQVFEGDVLFESDNDFEIPNLLLEQQGGHLELPFTPWGANSRLKKGVTTYHFYVDDYRFEKLFKDPTNLIISGCKAVVEPNFSLHDQIPIAYGLHLIYKKRWLGRYLQECGIKVYADLNVSHKFSEYNKMGIPKGYNAFFTRGTDGWLNNLKLDLDIAKEISGLAKPNLIVYGGGKEIKKYCQKQGLMYVTDFINEKKKEIL